MKPTLALNHEALDRVRAAHGITTNDELARRIGMNPSNLARVLRGDRSPGPRFLAQLMQAFPDANLDDLVVLTHRTTAAA